MLILGQYGASGVILFLAVLIVKYRSTGLTLTLALSIAGHVFNTSDAVTDQTQTGPLVVGVQLEHPNEPMVVHWLAECITQHPNAELLVLSEYTFDGPVPASVLDWCRSRQRHLIAGGKEPADGQDFRNTIFVVGPQGKIIHTQAKSVPIQFMSDGLPAISQELWQSPWGPIGIAVCYDLSYTRVIDRLVSDGAELIVNPTMDPEFWGEYQHTLHSRIPICRSVEYHVPVVRVASSGVSLITDRHGRILSSAAYARNAAMVSARPGQAKHTTLPVDRWLGPACTIATVLLMIATAWKRRGQPQPVTPEKLTAVE
jgi:apolipoprotein N-acyltransferase